jgi:hypothetical protein
MDTVSVVEVRPRWFGRATRLCRFQECELSAKGLPTTLQQTMEVGPLSQQIRALTATRGGDHMRSAALSLPDLSARMALFDFEAWPNKDAEREALLRFRFQKVLSMPMDDTRLVWRQFPRQRIREQSIPEAVGTGTASPHPIRVLAAMVPHAVLLCYERICGQAGLLPVSVGLASLWLFDFYRQVIVRKLQPDAHEFFFVHATSESFTFFAFREGCPSFIRTKHLRDHIGDSLAPVRNELVATLQFYDEIMGPRQTHLTNGQRPLFIISLDANILDPPTLESLRVCLIVLNWADATIDKESLGSIQRSIPLSVLPAAASVVRA